MNEIITIENTEMQIKEYNGQRVVTFKDIDTVHGNKTGTAKSNFARHKKHFVEGEDYILLTRGDSKGDKLSLLNIDIPTRGITVLTESGYLLIAKSFNDDLSWAVQRQLVNAYFKAKENTPLAPERKVSSVPAPRNTSWFYANKIKIDSICRRVGCSKQKLFHFILTKLGEEFDLETAKLVYIEENGYPPAYAISIVDYFPEIEERATYIVNRLYNSV